MWAPRLLCVRGRGVCGVYFSVGLELVGGWMDGFGGMGLDWGYMLGAKIGRVELLMRIDVLCIFIGFGFVVSEAMG